MKFYLIIVFGGISLFFIGCGDSSKPEPQKQMTLKMDVPQPKRLPKSEIKEKVVPEVDKSNKNFKLESAAIQKAIEANPDLNMESCLTLVSPFEQKKNAAQRHGGLWGALEKSPDFKDYSPMGMQLDSQLNKMVHALRHLCETANGLDYSPLAKVVLQQLEKKPEEQFKKELIERGEPEADVELLLNYVHFAQKAKNRQIDFSSIHRTLAQGASLTNHYVEFFNNIETNPDRVGQILPDLKAFQQALSDFITTDQNVKIAVLEDFKRPYLAKDGGM